MGGAMSSVTISGDTSGSIILQAPSVSGSTTLTLPTTSGTVLTNATTQANLPPNIAGNGPAFSAYLNGNQSISANTQTKTQFATKVFDTANCYDATTNYRFTPTVAGYYQFSFGTATNVSGSFAATLYKNGAGYSVGTIASSTTIGQQTTGSCLAYANGTTDYFEVYTYVSGAGQIAGNSSQVFFTGAMVRGA